MNSFDPKKFGAELDAKLKSCHLQIAKTSPAGKPGKNWKSCREFRLQPLDSAEKYSVEDLKRVLETFDVSDIKFNKISPNSSKFPSLQFKYLGTDIDLVLSVGQNAGERFEKTVVSDLHDHLTSVRSSDLARNLLGRMEETHPSFNESRITSVVQRTGSTKKEGVAIEHLGSVIGDMILGQACDTKWYVSLKNGDGDTFSSYSGGKSLFKDGLVQPESAGATFLGAFGVDLNLVQRGFDERTGVSSHVDVKAIEGSNVKIESIFNRAWGMNYFYAKQKPKDDWFVFYLDRPRLDDLSKNIRVDEICYPHRGSKQIAIRCSNDYCSYKIEIRNSSGGEYPNDIKFKVVKMLI